MKIVKVIMKSGTEHIFETTDSDPTKKILRSLGQTPQQKFTAILPPFVVDGGLVMATEEIESIEVIE